MYITFNGKFEKMDQRFDDMHQEFSSKFEKIDQRFEKIDQKIDDMHTEFSGKFQKLELIIENDITPKIKVLFDGQIQMMNQLNRIEEKVEHHEEIIFKRIK